jgi:hypothetical protein
LVGEVESIEKRWSVILWREVLWSSNVSMVCWKSLSLQALLKSRRKYFWG